MADETQDYATTIGADAVFKGELHFEKGLRLLGKFEGEIDSEGQLMVGNGATLTGDVRASSIRIEGKVKGNLNAKTKVQLSASARLEGDLQTARLEVAEGAVLIGRCVVGVNGDVRGGRDIKSATRSMSSVPVAKQKVGEAATVGAKK